ncbi:MAG: hypothetical protein ACO4CH_06395 [Saprospiraceae bacterium]|jgi:hypothetical protein
MPSSNSALTDPPGLTEVKGEVIFGSLSKNCRGVGICKVDVHGEGTTNCKKCPCRATAIIEVRSPDIVRFTFFTESLNTFLYNRYFRHDEFPVPEGFVFNSQLLKVLQIDEFVIKPGVYPVKNSGQTASVEFRSGGTLAIPPSRSLLRKRHGNQTDESTPMAAAS